MFALLWKIDAFRENNIQFLKKSFFVSKEMIGLQKLRKFERVSEDVQKTMNDQGI